MAQLETSRSHPARPLVSAGHPRRRVAAVIFQPRLSRDGGRPSGIRKERGPHSRRGRRVDRHRLGSLLARPRPVHEREERREALSRVVGGSDGVARARQARRRHRDRYAQHRLWAIDGVRSTPRQHAAQRLSHREHDSLDGSAGLRLSDHRGASTSVEDRAARLASSHFYAKGGRVTPVEFPE